MNEIDEIFAREESVFGVEFKFLCGAGCVVRIIHHAKMLPGKLLAGAEIQTVKVGVKLADI